MEGLGAGAGSSAGKARAAQAKSGSLARLVTWLLFHHTEGWRRGPAGLGVDTAELIRVQGSARILAAVHAAAQMQVLFLPHAIQQMLHPERMISAAEVRCALDDGVVIEDYPKDARGHSCLILGTGDSELLMSYPGFCSSWKIGEPECGADSQSAGSTCVWTPVSRRREESRRGRQNPIRGCPACATIGSRQFHDFRSSETPTGQFTWSVRRRKVTWPLLQPIRQPPPIGRTISAGGAFAEMSPLRRNDAQGRGSFPRRSEGIPPNARFRAGMGLHPMRRTCFCAPSGGCHSGSAPHARSTNG